MCKYNSHPRNSKWANTVGRGWIKILSITHFTPTGPRGCGPGFLAKPICGWQTLCNSSIFLLLLNKLFGNFFALLHQFFSYILHKNFGFASQRSLWEALGYQINLDWKSARLIKEPPTRIILVVKSSFLRNLKIKEKTVLQLPLSKIQISVFQNSTIVC